MREKKFRAWDKVAKKFLYPWPDGFHILGETTCFDLIGQQLKERSPEKSTFEMLNDVEITEWTGLLDKKGKEIYEGDIITNRSYDYKITFWSGAFWCQPVDEANEAYNLSLVHDHNMTGEIIGNIYNNLELLEKEK